MITDEQSKAVAEMAKTSGEVVKAAGGLGAYLGKVVGSIQDILGLVGGDWLHHKRQRHVAVLQVNTQRILEGVAPDRLTEPSPSVIIPLLQAAVDEGRPELQAMWAALMANAMLEGGRKVRRDYFDAVRRMEPVDALYLQVVAGAPLDPSGSSLMGEANRAGIDSTDQAIAEIKLVQLACMKPAPWPALTAFGRGLLAAVSVDGQRGDPKPDH